MGLLRFFFALSVITSHSTSINGVSFVGGLIAVQSFFMMSGFYMSLILNEKYIGKNNSYLLFFTNRLLRLYPAYWLVLLCVIAFSLFQYYITRTVAAVGDNYGVFSIYRLFEGQMNVWTLLVFIVANLFIIGQDLLFFFGLNLQTGALFFVSDITNLYPALHSFMLISVSWAIAVEIGFYIVAPFIVRRSIRIIGLLVVASILLRGVLSALGLSFDPWMYRFFPTLLVYFLLGNLSYRIYKGIRLLGVETWKLQLFFLLFIIITIFYKMSFMAGSEIYYLFFLMMGMPLIFFLTKDSNIDRYLGELSYIIFIAHIFILSLLDYFHITMFNSVGFTLSVAVVMFAIAINEIFLKRIERYRQHRITRRF